MKKIKFVGVFLSFLFYVGLLISCAGLVKTDKVQMKSVYSDNEFVLDLDNVYWDQGSRAAGGIWYKTSKAKDEAYEELQRQGITEIKINYMDYKFIQIQNKGLFSLKMGTKGNYTTVEINEMSFNGIPFPLYAIDYDRKANLNNVIYEYQNLNVDFNSTKELIKNFQNRLNVYSKVEERDSTMKLYFKDKSLLLSYDNNILKIE